MKIIAYISQRSSIEPPKSILEKEKRFAMPITINQEITCPQFYRKVKNLCGANLYSNNVEVNIFSSLILCKGKKILDVMDAIAALYQGKWQKENAGYGLNTGASDLDGYLPTSYFENERDKEVPRFFEGIKGLPDGFKDRFISKDDNPKISIPVRDLPSSSQDILQKIVDLLDTQHKEEDQDRALFGTDLLQSKIHIKDQSEQGITNYFVSVMGSVGTAGFLLSNYSDVRSKINKNPNWHVPGKNLIFDKKQPLNKDKYKALKRHHPLEQMIEFNEKNIPLYAIVRKINEKTNIAIISDRVSYLKERQDVVIPRTTVQEAIEKLMKIYQGTEWEWRESEFLVVRSASNPNTEAWAKKGREKREEAIRPKLPESLKKDKED
jgi:hypothetical protein